MARPMAIFFVQYKQAVTLRDDVDKFLANIRAA